MRKSNDDIHTFMNNLVENNYFKSSVEYDDEVVSDEEVIAAIEDHIEMLVRKNNELVKEK